MATLLLIGDSILGGWYATSYEHSLKARVIAAFTDPTVVEAEFAHATTTRVASVVSVPIGVDVVLVALGTNDVGHTAPWTFRRQYRALLADITAQSPATVVCVGVWRPWHLAVVYDRVIRREAHRAGARFVPIRDLYRLRGPAGRATWRGESDTFHPNDDGHQAIADRTIAAIT